MPTIIPNILTLNKAIPKNSTDLSAIEVKLKKLLKNFKVKK